MKMRLKKMRERALRVYELSSARTPVSSKNKVAQTRAREYFKEEGKRMN